MNKNNEVIVVDEQMLEATDSIRKAITDKHKKVSEMKTPKPFIKKKMNMDYVEYSYMREVADKEYPGWSWTIQNSEVLGSEAYVVHGRLKWYDEGIWREADMVAAHRIQKKRGTNEFVDIGNDIKASNTDCIKKAFNMYLNIADDVYRNQVEESEMTDKQKDELLKLSKKANIYDEILNKIENGTIHGLNYKASLAKLKRLTTGVINEKLK